MSTKKDDRKSSDIHLFASGFSLSTMFFFFLMGEIAWGVLYAVSFALNLIIYLSTK